jgi:hypothetical protein
VSRTEDLASVRRVGRRLAWLGLLLSVSGPVAAEGLLALLPSVKDELAPPEFAAAMLTSAVAVVPAGRDRRRLRSPGLKFTFTGLTDKPAMAGGAGGSLADEAWRGIDAGIEFRYASRDTASVLGIGSRRSNASSFEQSIDASSTKPSKHDRDRVV